jgi:hypothetical protein
VRLGRLDDGFPFRARRRFAGLHFVATDTAWEVGAETRAEAPMGAWLLLLTGRPAALPELSGPGATVVASAFPRRGPRSDAGQREPDAIARAARATARMVNGGSGSCARQCSCSRCRSPGDSAATCAPAGPTPKV